MRPIDADALKKYCEDGLAESLDLFQTDEYKQLAIAITKSFIDDIEEQPTIYAEPVTRCKDCIYWHKPHVRDNDGNEHDYSEFPEEAFGQVGLVTLEYGFNVGGQCEREKNVGYAVDKTVFRNEDDFCSRAVKARADIRGETE